MSSVVHSDSPYPKRLVGPEEALEQYGEIVPGLLPLLPHESLYEGVEWLKGSRDAWEKRARSLDWTLKGACEVLLWISEAATRDESLRGDALALAEKAREALSLIDRRDRVSAVSGNEEETGC
jgi:hypothetical protein